MIIAMNGNALNRKYGVCGFIGNKIYFVRQYEIAFEIVELNPDFSVKDALS